MSNTLFWGPPGIVYIFLTESKFHSLAWDFFHQLAWIFPKEILDSKQGISVIRFCHLVVLILPCYYCSESAPVFEKECGLFTSLTYDIGGLKVITRSNIAKFWFDMHNKVNVKLGYPTLKGTWRESVKHRPNWEKNMFIFLFAICWNLPERDTPDDIVSLYYTFFQLSLPKVLSTTKVGKLYAKYTEKHPLTKGMLKKRHLTTKWIYDARSVCEEFFPYMWDYASVDLFLETFRAKITDCKPGEQHEKTNAQGDEIKGCL